MFRSDPTIVEANDDKTDFKLTSTAHNYRIDYILPPATAVDEVAVVDIFLQTNAGPSLISRVTQNVCATGPAETVADYGMVYHDQLDDNSYVRLIPATTFHVTSLSPNNGNILFTALPVNEE